MARNRKSQSATIRFGPAVKAVLLCLLIGGSGVGYVWQEEQLAKLGRQIISSESRLKQLDQQNEIARRQLATMRSPQFLRARIKDANMGLVLPEQSQLLRLNEPVAEPPRAEAEPQYASRSDRHLFGQ
jgi:hypothetical protein